MRMNQVAGMRAPAGLHRTASGSALPPRHTLLVRAASGPEASPKGPSPLTKGSIKMPAPRPSVPAPEPVPIVHSSAYLVQKRRQEKREACDISTPASTLSNDGRWDEEPFTGNAVQFLLRKGDNTLDQIETAPGSVSVALERAMSSPAAQIAGYVAKSGARLTAKATQEALEAGLPVARKMAVQGLTLAGKAIEAGLRSEGQRRERGQQGSAAAQAPARVDAQDGQEVRS